MLRAGLEPIDDSYIEITLEYPDETCYALSRDDRNGSASALAQAVQGSGVGASTGGANYEAMRAEALKYAAGGGGGGGGGGGR